VGADQDWWVWLLEWLGFDVYVWELGELGVCLRAAQDFDVVDELLNVLVCWEVECYCVFVVVFVKFDVDGEVVVV